VEKKLHAIASSRVLALSFNLTHKDILKFKFK